jgi:NAD(P)-dependent dehydrogenase (short-subunit alcohol dehydrogenase family)
MGVAGLARIVALEGERFHVRANTVSPGAATRLTDSVPTRDPEAIKRREQMREINSPVRPAQLAVALSSPASAPISGQVFGVGGYNLSIYQQPRPIVTYSRDGGWTADAIIADFFPRIEAQITPLGWPAAADPIPVPAGG